MMRMLPWLAVALIGTAAPVHAQTRTDRYETGGQPEQVDGTSQAKDLAFKKDRYERMTVPVHVGGSGPYRFLIDTGADRTAISMDLARRLGLRHGAQATLHTVAGQSQVGTARVPLLDMAAKQVTNLDAAVLESQFMGADGILGLDSLRSQRILFDFKRQMLTIVPSRAKMRDRDEIVVTGRIRNGRFILADAVVDDAMVTLVIDTGAEVSIGNEALRRKLRRRPQKEGSGQVELHSVAGEKLVGDYMIVPEIRMGDVTMKQLPIVFADSHGFEPLGLANKPALLLGMNALMGFEKVSIDFARRKMRVVLREESSLNRSQLASR